ncbi:hypothetical protein CKU38_00502 [Xanthomonas citri pv. fuscans]|nr:hypothetical protein CKU38_00502 [Xanthomonas citri pv. fuscans]
MSWYGKLLGALAGALLFRGAPVVGLMIGLAILPERPPGLADGSCTGPTARAPINSAGGGEAPYTTRPAAYPRARRVPGTAS